MAARPGGGLRVETLPADTSEESATIVDRYLWDCNSMVGLGLRPSRRMADTALCTSLHSPSMAIKLLPYLFPETLYLVLHLQHQRPLLAHIVERLACYNCHDGRHSSDTVWGFQSLRLLHPLGPHRPRPPQHAPRGRRPRSADKHRLSGNRLRQHRAPDVPHPRHHRDLVPTRAARLPAARRRGVKSFLGLDIAGLYLERQRYCAGAQEDPYFRVGS